MQKTNWADNIYKAFYFTGIFKLFACWVIFLRENFVKEGHSTCSHEVHASV